MSDDDVTKPNVLLKYIDDPIGCVSSLLAEIVLYPSWYLYVRRIIRPFDSFDGVMDETFRTRGVLGFYSGIGLGIAHKALNDVITSNIYKTLNNTFEAQEEQDKLGGNIDIVRTGLLILSSGISSIITTPFLVIQNNILSNPYLSVSDVWTNLTSEFGASILFKGALPVAFATMIKKFVQFFGTPYIGDLVKTVSKSEDQRTLNTLTLMGASLLSSFITAPIYFAVVYLQASRNFSSTSECWSRMSATGCSVLWSGFPANFVYESPKELLTLCIRSKLHDHLDKK